MAFKKQLVTSCKQAIWGEILGGNAPNYARDKTNAGKKALYYIIICLKMIYLQKYHRV